MPQLNLAKLWRQNNHHQWLLLLITIAAMLISSATALTPEELGTVSTVNGTPCRFCVLDCEQSPLLKNCKSRYYQYGCHINQYCLTVNTATSREFFAGLALCIFRNGCELTNSTERAILNQTSEGRLDLQMKDYVAAQIPTLQTNNVNLYKLQGEVYSTYYSQISAIENAWINSANKLTEGKRKGFQLINISPAFFLLQDLMNVMFNSEGSKWQPICAGKPEMMPQYGTEQYFAPLHSDVKTDALIGKCAVLRNELVANGFDESQFLLNTIDQAGCRRKAMYLYVFRHICTLPRDFLITARLADQLVGDDGDFLTDMLFIDFVNTIPYRAPTIVNGQVTGTVQVQPTMSRIQDLFVALQTYAFQYVGIMENAAMDAATKQTNLALIANDLLAKSARCSGLYCTYLCKDYAYDIGTKYCDIYDESVDFIRNIFVNLCKVQNPDGSYTDFSYTAEMRPLKLREANVAELKYCKASQRAVGRTKQEYCLYSAMKATADQFYYNYVEPAGEGQAGSVNSPMIMQSYMNGAMLREEAMVTELEYFYARFSTCTGTVCSRAAGCDVQYSDLAAMRPYFDTKSAWLDNFLGTYNYGWKRLMTSQPKMTIVEGSDRAFWFKTLNPITGAWGEFVSMGGLFKAPPAAVATNGGGVTVVGWYDDNTLRYRQYANGQWSSAGWVNLGGSLSAKPAVITIWNRIYVFFVSSGTLYYTYLEGSNWSSFVSLGGPVASAPTAVNWGSNKVLVFARQSGTNKVMYRMFAGNDAAGFQPWVNLDGYITGEITTVMAGDGRLFSFVRGSDGALWHNVNENESWLVNWQSLQGGIQGNPSAVVFGESGEKIFAFVKGTDNAVWWRLYSNNQWSGWQSIGGNVANGVSPVAVAWDPHKVAVYATFASDSSVYYKLYKNGQWSSTWTPLYGNVLGEAAPLALK